MRLRLRNFAVLAVFLALAALSLRAAAGDSFRFVDDRGRVVDAALELCFTLDLKQECETASGDASWTWLEGASALRIEGERHGPVRVVRSEVSPELVVPRKARVTVLGLSGSAELSLYPLDDPLFRKPSVRLDLMPGDDGTTRVWVPAGELLASISRQGRAPHLKLLSLLPGAEQTIESRSRPGWSLVLRTVDEKDGLVSGASIEIAETVLDNTEKSEHRWSATTDDRGLAVVSGVTVGLAQALSEHPEYLPAEIYGLASSPGSFAVRTVRHTRGARLEGTVNLEGEPTQGVDWGLARLEGDRRDWRRDLEILVSGRTAEEGRFTVDRLVPGRYVVILEPSGEGSRYLEVVQLVADRPETRAFDLWSSQIRGEVVRGETPVSGFELTLAPVGPELGHQPVEISDTSKTDEDGKFELVSWQEGRHLVKLQTTAGAPVSTRLVVLNGSDEEIEFRLPAHPVTGQVVDHEGEPVAGARIVLAGPSTGGSNAMRTATSDEDGQFEAFWDLDSDIELYASKEGFAPSSKVGRRVSWSEPSLPVRLTLERRATLTGRIVGPTGEGLAGVKVWKVAQSDIPRVIGEATTGSDGGFEIVGQAIGEAGTLWVSGPGCPLVSFISPSLDETIDIQCATSPGILVVHLTSSSEDAPLVGRSLLLRHATATRQSIVPEHVLSLHLAQHGLPPVSNGTGTLVLLLAPGQYDLYLAGASSVESIARDLPHGYLGQVVLDAGTTREVEVVEQEPRF